MSVETEASGNPPGKGDADVQQKQTKNASIDTLIGPKTRINGDVEFTGGLHLDGYINGNVKGDSNQRTFFVGGASTAAWRVRLSRPMSS